MQRNVMQRNEYMIRCKYVYIDFIDIIDIISYYIDV